jgi:hypothetical protein
MNKLIISLLFLTLFKLSAQDKYKVEYEFFETGGEHRKTFTLSRDGDKIKIKGVDKYGGTVTMYIYKDERAIYTLTEQRDVKIGTKFNGLDCSYVGMQWGVYILDLDKCEFVLQSSTLQGTATVAGKECNMYNMMTSGDLRTDYYFYNNNLMLKRTAPTTTIQALSFDDNPVFAPDEFTKPANILWTE